MNLLSSPPGLKDLEDGLGHLMLLMKERGCLPALDGLQIFHLFDPSGTGFMTFQEALKPPVVPGPEPVLNPGVLGPFLRSLVLDKHDVQLNMLLKKKDQIAGCLFSRKHSGPGNAFLGFPVSLSIIGKWPPTTTDRAKTTSCSSPTPLGLKEPHHPAWVLIKVEVQSLV